MSSYCVVLVTAKNKTEARKIARGLLQEQLIACANIIDGVESLFTWKGRVTKSSEALLVMKTRLKIFKQVEACVKRLHSYQTPEIIALPVGQGSGEYFQWMDDVLIKEAK